MNIQTDKFYSQSRHLRNWHHLMIETDPRIHDYLAAAPILILPLTEGAFFGDQKHRAFVCRRAGEICNRGDKLNALMKNYRIAKPMRKISADCITPKRQTMFDILGRIPPSILSQAISQSTLDQVRYFNNIMKWSNRIIQRGLEIRQNEMIWAATNLQGTIKGNADDLADWFIWLRNTGNKNFKFSFQTAIKRMEKWHDESISLARIEQCELRYGVRDDYPVPYAPMPERMSVDGYEFVALQTYKSLITEGANMRHCVGSYFNDVLNCGTRIYSIQKAGNKLATLEYRPNSLGSTVLRLGQLKAKRNAKPSAKIRQVVNEFTSICRGKNWLKVVPEHRKAS